MASLAPMNCLRLRSAWTRPLWWLKEATTTKTPIQSPMRTISSLQTPINSLRTPIAPINGTSMAQLQTCAVLNRDIIHRESESPAYDGPGKTTVDILNEVILFNVNKVSNFNINVI